MNHVPSKHPKNHDSGNYKSGDCCSSMIFLFVGLPLFEKLENTKDNTGDRQDETDDDHQFSKVNLMRGIIE